MKEKRRIFMNSLIDIEKLPEPIKKEVIDFADYLIDKYHLRNELNKTDVPISETAILSESSLARDWDKKEEEEAWKNL
jgi:hypothetical protein